MTFVNATNGYFSVHSVMTIEGEEYPIDTPKDFSYTFDGIDGVITTHYTDRRHNELIDRPFHYNAEDGCIYYGNDDMMFVYTQVR